MNAERLAYGDRVRHPRRPEWGTGTIMRVEVAAVQGHPTQRVSVRFDNAGMKILDTAAAPLERVNGATGPIESGKPDGPGALERLERSDLPESLLLKKVQEVMTSLPEEVRDPFNSIAYRLQRTCELYRFTRDGASLIHWAVAQTGLSDPMTRFNRHELEVFFDRWAREREAHLVRLIGEAGKDPQAMRNILAKAPRTALEVVRRLKVTR